MFTRTRLLPLALAFATLPTIAQAASPAQPDQLAAAVDGPAAEQDIPRAKDGLFYVDVLINGQSIRFLVDTGANVVVLTGADAARLGIQAECGAFGPRMATAGGSAPMAWARLDHVRLAGREVHGVKAAVVQSGLPVSLLGQSGLSQLGSVTIEGDRLRMR